MRAAKVTWSHGIADPFTSGAVDDDPVEVIPAQVRWSAIV